VSIHPVIRGLHDVGLATWAGGSLMGAVGLNGAVSLLNDPAERARVSTAGWTRWAPVNAAAVGAHLVGATGLLVTDWPRVRSQRGVATSSAIKTAATGAGLGVAAWSAVLNRKMARTGPVPVAGATEAGAGTPADVAATLRQLKLVQWLNPAVAMGLIALADYQSQQQRASEEVRGRVQRLLGAGSGSTGAAALALPVAVGLLARRRRAARTRPQLDLVGGTASRSTGAASSAPFPVPSPAPSRTDARTDVSAARSTSGQASGGSMTRSEEQLRVGTETTEAGRAALRKTVVEEPVTTTVPVSHEEPVVEREPITEENLDKALDGPELTEREHEVVLHAEEPVVTKETVPVETVALGTQTVHEERQIEETVRKERIDTGGGSPLGTAGRTDEDGGTVDGGPGTPLR